MAVEFNAGRYIPNSATADNGVVFDKSKTGTTYQRYEATYRGENDEVKRCLLFLISDLVVSLALRAQNVQGTRIFVSDIDFRNALKAQKPEALEAGQPRFVFSQFTLVENDEIAEVLTKAAIDVKIAEQAQQKKDIRARKAQYLLDLAAGITTSPLPESQRRRGAPSPTNEQTHENRAKEMGSNEAINGGEENKPLSTPDNLDKSQEEVDAEMRAKIAAEKGEEIPV